MRVEVLLFGPPRDTAGIPEEKISIEKGSKLEDLVRLLKVRHGPTFSKAVRGKGSTIILVNGLNPDSLEGMKTVLKDGDTVAILPATFGG